MIRTAGALLSGALAVFAFAPFSLPLFALISPAALFLLLKDIQPLKAAWIGWCYGCGFFGAGVSWVWVSIHVYGGASVLLATLATSLFVMALALLFALQAWLLVRIFHSKTTSWLGFIAVWIGFEWLRSWFLTGFPWLLLGYTWLDTPLKSLAGLSGVWGLSLMTLCLAIGSVQAITQRSSKPLFLALALPLLSLSLPSSWTSEKPVPHLQVALVQPNISQHEKWDSSQLEAILQQHIDLSKPYQDHDLIVWPETAIPSLYYQAAPYTEDFFSHLNTIGTTLISGFPFMTYDTDNPDIRRFHNSLGIFSQGNGVYHKQRLVPFGEYVPLEQQLRGLIDFFDLPMSEFSLPEHTDLMLQVGQTQLATLICYEIAYPELTRRSAMNSDLILTVSNDAWFGDSLAAEQHLQIARMRALENGRWVIRGTNDGITAVIAPDGGLNQRLSRKQPGVLSASIPSMQGQTPYQKVGVWPVLGISLLLLLLGLWPRPWRAFKDHAMTG
ncbi:apolipoprotein N-acyltransferase [Nitrincola iocasae]|uniref:Apolipoprotein N-acyltransferase n=1 Tax=Nitrincola iocasae TaxID=2614693 RepID=A0A5J6LAP6_9GAMM|nr:apolipoprotein N-acyltransferase [Nitrincola iocasae]QEW05441.1 apolipoprotein N-acyltransferase [Nitrincola iocasae]